MARKKKTEAPVDYTRDPVRFLREQILRTERGRDYKLPAHHAQALTLAFVWTVVPACERCAALEEPTCVGHLQFRLLVWSEPKKSGKSLMCGLLVLWWALTRPGVEVLLCANDLEQSTGRVFSACRGLLKHNPHLDPGAEALERQIRFSNGSLIIAMAADWKGISGANHGLAVVDEPAGVTEERAVRLLEELTPVATEEDAWTLMAGVAGWTGESLHWESIYKRALTGEVLDATLPLYRAAEMIAFWSTTPRMPTQTAKYLAEQEASLRPLTYLRLWGNKWVTNESTLITDRLWDGNVDPSHHPITRNKDLVVDLALDGAVKKDCAACVAVARIGEDLMLVNHQIWTPTPGHPLDLELTMESWVHTMAANFTIRSVTCDPMQLQRFIGAGKRMGLPMVEYAQTIPNLTKMGETLLACLRGQTIRLYPDPELRQHALNTVGVESPRGFRISKTTASRKIDGIIALAMACVAALDGLDVHLPTPEEEREMEYQEARYLRMLGYPASPAPYGGWANVVAPDYGPVREAAWPGQLDADFGYCDEPL